MFYKSISVQVISVFLNILFLISFINKSESKTCEESDYPKNIEAQHVSFLSVILQLK